MKSSEYGLGRVVRGLGLGLLAVACAAQPKAELAPPGSLQAAPPAASAPAPAEPTTLEEAEALLEQSRSDLESLALNEPAPTSADTAAPKAAAPAPAAPARVESRRAEESADGAAPATQSENRCETACRAFSSLNRASDAVCRLDADGGKRCERARQIREQASQRVASCGCVK